MKNFLLLSVALIIVVIGAVVSSNWELFQVDPNLFDNGSSVFLKYGIIIIAIERAAMVFIGIQYETTKKKIKTDIKNLDNQIQSLQLQINSGGLADGALIAANNNLTQAVQDKETEENNLVNHRNMVQRIALKVVFLAGIVLAIGGLSILNDMFYTPDSWSDCEEVACKMQMYIFRLLDILITGGLIGGGSKSFHKFLSNIDEYVESRKS